MVLLVFSVFECFCSGLVCADDAENKLRFSPVEIKWAESSSGGLVSFRGPSDHISSLCVLIFCWCVYLNLYMFVFQWLLPVCSCCLCLIVLSLSPLVSRWRGWASPPGRTSWSSSTPRTTGTWWCVCRAWCPPTRAASGSWWGPCSATSRGRNKWGGFYSARCFHLLKRPEVQWKQE